MELNKNLLSAALSGECDTLYNKGMVGTIPRGVRDMQCSWCVRGSGFHV